MHTQSSASQCAAKHHSHSIAFATASLNTALVHILPEDLLVIRALTCKQSPLLCQYACG